MTEIERKGFTFIDLFAGIGGFHQAMKKLNGTCVYAAEISKDAVDVYKKNYNMDALQDIKKIIPSDVPFHDVLCAGFPCQSFSKAGFQKGFLDTRGTLFFEILKIVKEHKKSNSNPKYIILENVRNLISHDEGKTWIVIRKALEALDYNVIKAPIISSPHFYNIPQLRERAIILAVRKDIYQSEIILNVDKKKKNTTDFNTVIQDDDEYVLKNYKISLYEEKVLDMWDDFMKIFKNKTLGFPLWTDEFKQTYEIDELPKWKQLIIEKNRNIYIDNKEKLDIWFKKYKNLKWVKKTHRKFEWQANHSIDSIYEGIIQFRPSGVRVKKPTEFPALVAMIHVPIIGKYRRYITPREAANMQSFPSEFEIHQNDRVAYKQFGNSVNINVIYNIFLEFIKLVERGEANE